MTMTDLTGKFCPRLLWLSWSSSKSMPHFATTEVLVFSPSRSMSEDLSIVHMLLWFMNKGCLQGVLWFKATPAMAARQHCTSGYDEYNLHAWNAWTWIFVLTTKRVGKIVTVEWIFAMATHSARHHDLAGTHWSQGPWQKMERLYMRSSNTLWITQRVVERLWKVVASTSLRWC
jgi:hypothetical protein